MLWGVCHLSSRLFKKKLPYRSPIYFYFGCKFGFINFVSLKILSSKTFLTVPDSHPETSYQGACFSSKGSRKNRMRKSTVRTFVMGDIHGAHKALQQCLERAPFDKDKDTLIQLGDIADGFGEVHDCVEELLKIRNLIAIKGNHDEWLNQFLQTGYHPMAWNKGGAATAYPIYE